MLKIKNLIDSPAHTGHATSPLDHMYHTLAYSLFVMSIQAKLCLYFVGDIVLLLQIVEKLFENSVNQTNSLVANVATGYQNKRMSGTSGGNFS